MKMLKKLTMAAALFGLAGAANATVIFDSWTTNEGETGNYIVSITLNGGVFEVELTVDPWNAEALGIFFDLGDNDIADNSFGSELPAGQVARVATDTTSNDCGPGCNLEGLSPPIADPDGEWEWVFSLGGAGFDGIQTFSWEMAANGLTEDDFGLIGIRSQALCEPGDLLPDGECGGSDKSYSNGEPPQEIMEPGSLALFGLGIGLLGFMGRRRKNG